MKKLIFILLFGITFVFGLTEDEYKAFNAFEKKDYKTAFTVFGELALKGDSKSQAIIGFMYYEGKGVRQDYIKAIDWYLKSANQVHISEYLNSVSRIT